MKNLKQCPVCHNELSKSSIFFIDSSSVCEHCHHQISIKKWIKLIVIVLSLVLLAVMFNAIDTLSFLFILVFQKILIISLTKVFGYKSVELSNEDYLEEYERLYKTDSQGFNRNKELIRRYIISISLVTFFFILPSILYRLNLIDIHQLFFVEGLSFPFAWFFVFYIFLYNFKDEWYYRIAYNKLKFIPLMISALLLGHVLSLMLSVLVFGAYEIYFEHYFNYLLLLLVLGLIVQLFIIKKTNLK